MWAGVTPLPLPAVRRGRAPRAGSRLAPPRPPGALLLILELHVGDHDSHGVVGAGRVVVGGMDLDLVPTIEGERYRCSRRGSEVGDMALVRLERRVRMAGRRHLVGRGRVPACPRARSD